MPNADEDELAAYCRNLAVRAPMPKDQVDLSPYASKPDGRYRCPRLRCTRHADGESPPLCAVFDRPMIATPWRVVVIVEPLSRGPVTEVLLNCLRSATAPVTGPSEGDYPLMPHGFPIDLPLVAEESIEPGRPRTIVAASLGSQRDTSEAIRRRLERGDAVVLITWHWVADGDHVLDRWPVHVIDFRPVRPVRPVPPLRRSTTGLGNRYTTDLDTASPTGMYLADDAPVAAEPPLGRRVNIVPAFVTGGPITGEVQPRQTYVIRVGIGARLPQSIVAATAPPFPAHHLGGVPDGWWLQCVLSDGDRIAGHGVFYLPRDGHSFVCGCVPGGRHTCPPASRTGWLELSVRALPEPGEQRLQLAVHLGAAAIQTFEITVQVGFSFGPTPPEARAAFTLSTDLERLERFDGRAVSIRSGGHALIVKTATGDPIGFTLTDAQAGTAARGMRATLFDRQLIMRRRGLESRFDTELGKSPDDYRADLLALARVGAEAYAALLPSWPAREGLAAALHESDDGPPVIQVAQAEGSRPVVPWQLIYDEPIVPGAGDLVVCPSVREFGPGSAAGPVPSRCPYAERHGGYPGTLCPFGFWGLANILEVPPSSRWMNLAAVTGTGHPPSVVVALDPSLADAAWDRHRATLDRVGVPVPSVVTTDVAGMRAAVLNGVDLLYFLCHGRRVAGAGTTEPGLALDLGRGGRLTPQDVTNWAGLRPRVRWTERRPFVVLNGCHTGERLPDTLTDFASAFVESTGAAGVLVTEVTMERRLACHIMDVFVSAWAGGEGAGAAVRRMRWDLLRRGNVMGLAYSPYCDADLRLPRSERLPA